MNSWIPHPLILTTDRVSLEPLEGSHLAELETLALNPRVWEFYAGDLSLPGKFEEAFRQAFRERDLGAQYPIVIRRRDDGRLIGSTRFLAITAPHRKLEIGWTWMDPATWGTGINTECKLALLTACFETLGTVRVQLKTDELNLRSRRAIEKIGARFEGILSNYMIRDNGTLRNSAYFSIIAPDWPGTKSNLTRLVRGTEDR
jgi:RimJ/RimL family protein N-acetyltransferase